ncbi:glycosyltransferase family 4 protein [Flexistipes sinusarabici]|uniref:glycosyltransferase family 4 protein n=1 Tax=Flexistipes sinusarabici TaxID=2352 RepID=UPI0023535FC3|nr:glycosyltransferase family 4 protein [Flexistipes sinusarabici]
MHRMNIALLHYSCPPVVGGVEEILRQQALLFSRNFNNVKIFAGTGSQFAKNIPVEINPLLGSQEKTVEMSVRMYLQGQKELFYNLKEKIKNYLLKSLEPFDLLIAHNVLTMRYNLPLTYAIHEIAEKNETEVVSWNHDCLFFYKDSGRKFSHEIYKILRQFNKKLTYVAVSESRKKDFEKLYGKDDCVTTIPNGIDPKSFYELDDSSVKIIDERNLLKADFIMVQPSRLHPRKNIELSIKVTSELTKKGLDAILIVTGAFDPHEEGTRRYYNNLKQMINNYNIENNVIILAEYRLKSGELINSNRLNIRDLYLISDILFLPSFHEGFGIPLLEAGMIKLPVVCSDIPPFRTIGEDSVTYFKLDETPGNIADKIIEFLKNSSTGNFFRKVIKKYSWDNIYEKNLQPFLSHLYVKRNKKTLDNY